jgi:branched-chain amino acid transport system permease protein
MFSASILGGLLNIYGAVVGGFLVGLVEVLGTTYLGQYVGLWMIPYRPSLPLVMMVIVLMVAPLGIGGVSRSRFRRGK